MAERGFEQDQALHAYIEQHSALPDAVEAALIEETLQLDEGVMQIGGSQATFMGMLARSIGARMAVEVGTFTGYSALAVARAIGPQGKLICCDISVEWTDIARRYWTHAGVADRIDLRIAPALETLSELPVDEHIDFAFIDADKTGYIDYYEALLPRMTRHGIMLVDNVLWSAKVLDDTLNDENTVAIRAFNDHVAADSRSEQAMLPIGDGVLMIRRI